MLLHRPKREAERASVVVIYRPVDGRLREVARIDPYDKVMDVKDLTAAEAKQVLEQLLRG